MSTPIRTAILGASGYTGAELLRLLQGHPRFEIVALTGDSQAGKPMAQVYPHLRAQSLPPLVKHTEVDFNQIDFVFCCLPHGTTQSIIAGLPAHVKIVDLSADFRLFDPAAYQEWYGHAHAATELQRTAVYGLTEHAREAVKAARLVANPGCYPTSILLPLLPLFRAALVQPNSVTVDSMSGVSGAGRSVKQEMLYNEIEGGASAYSIGAHRHMAEIEQELEKVVCEPGEPAMSPRSGAQASPAGDLPEPLKISFTPHLVPFTRGMLSTIHVQLADGRTADDARACLQQAYAQEPFVQVLASGSPRTHEVRGTNQCFMSVHAGRRAGELIIVSVIDNLVKGASGQALQNANLMIGLPETTNLELTAVFP
ncbi:MAG: N-acetyl-gamma-glutamyl-phosphate reductase [Azospirillum brasilense]|nr:MAG: N-acetyl-gamma-glutamyl-phosphate reductase [Azospirillum brasilense]